MARGWPCCAKAWQAHHAPHTSKRFAVSSSPSTPPWRACSPATCAWDWGTRSKKPSPTWPSAAPNTGTLRDGPPENRHLRAAGSCRRVGPTGLPEPLKKQEEVFSERMSILFKRLRIVRMVDPARNTLVYLTYSEKLIDGSPQNSVTAVPVDRAMAIPLRK